jgi:two-component system chemotaxis response regulator CheB
MTRTGVLIVDDSATARAALRRVLESAPDIHVIDTAIDPLFALPKMNRQWPDVIVLDMEMPRMDGLTFLRRLMQTRPTPVVVCSTLTTRGAEVALQALASGAVAVFSKEELGVGSITGAAHGGALVDAVRAAAASRVARPRVASAPAPVPASPLAVTTERLVALGMSTGGTRALEYVLPQLPRTCPGVVVVQHMPANYTKAFAERLDRMCAVDVREAVGGERLLPGTVLIAPGGRHLQIRRDGAYYRAEVVDGPPVNRHKPSVDVLFRSVARHAGKNATALLLTGMGDDGARGLLELRQAGARTFAQDEATSVVFGMPREAIALGAAERVISLEQVAATVCGAT